MGNNNIKTKKNGNGNKNNTQNVGKNTMKNAIKKAVNIDENKVIKGKIKWYDIRKGYGFIVTDEGEEYFVHFSGIESGRSFIGFDNNDPVSFRLIPGEKGPQAVGVNILEEELSNNDADSESEEVEEDSNVES